MKTTGTEECLTIYLLVEGDKGATAQENKEGRERTVGGQETIVEVEKAIVCCLLMLTTTTTFECMDKPTLYQCINVSENMCKIFKPF